MPAVVGLVLFAALALASPASARTVFGSNGCGTSEYKPKVIAFACADGKLVFETSAWTVWDDSEALADGVLAHPDLTAPGKCQQTVLACPWVKAEATLRMWEPVHCPGNGRWQFTRLLMEAPEDSDPEVRQQSREFRCGEYRRPPRRHRLLRVGFNCQVIYIGELGYVFYFAEMGCQRARQLATYSYYERQHPPGFHCRPQHPVQGGTACVRDGNRRKVFGWYRENARPVLHLPW